MAWACVTHNWKGPIICLDLVPESTTTTGKKKGGGLNSPHYVDQILEGPLKEFLDMVEEEEGREALLAEDGAPYHWSAVAKNVCHELGIMNLEHPPSSPDLNPIVWLVLKIHVADIPLSQHSLDGLWAAIQQVWDELTIKEIRKHWKDVGLCWWGFQSKGLAYGFLILKTHLITSILPIQNFNTQVQANMRGSWVMLQCIKDLMDEYWHMFPYFWQARVHRDFASPVSTQLHHRDVWEIIGIEDVSFTKMNGDGKKAEIEQINRYTYKSWHFAKNSNMIENGVDLPTIHVNWVTWLNNIKKYIHSNKKDG